MVLSDWKDFAVAQVGASAALAGLIFVGASINISAIRAWTNLRPRVLEAVVVLAAVFLICSLVLLPGQPPAAVGAEIIGVGVALFLTEFLAAVSALRAPHLLGSILTADRTQTLPKEFRTAYLAGVVIVLVGALLFIIAGGSLVASGTGGGVFPWLPIGVFLCYVIAVVDAYMFLILLKDPAQMEATPATVHGASDAPMDAQPAVAPRVAR